MRQEKRMLLRTWRFQTIKKEKLKLVLRKHIRSSQKQIAVRWNTAIRCSRKMPRKKCAGKSEERLQSEQELRRQCWWQCLA